MATAGADILVPHMGLTTDGMTGAKTSIGLAEAVEAIDRLGKIGKETNPDCIVLCHGGPISGPDELAYVLSHSEYAQGFLGASSMERLPTERAMVDHMARFVELGIGPKGREGETRPR